MINLSNNRPEKKNTKLYDISQNINITITLNNTNIHSIKNKDVDYRNIEILIFTFYTMGIPAEFNK